MSLVLPQLNANLFYIAICNLRERGRPTSRRPNLELDQRTFIKSLPSSLLMKVFEGEERTSNFSLTCSLFTPFQHITKSFLRQRVSSSKSPSYLSTALRLWLDKREGRIIYQVPPQRLSSPPLPLPPIPTLPPLFHFSRPRLYHK